MGGRSIGIFVLSAIFTLSVSSVAGTYGGGNGTQADPYQIRTPEQMNTIGVNSADWGKHFKLMNDIDMSAYTGTQYNIIGNQTTPFSGSFDGNQYVIHNLTYVTSEAVEYAGIFGYLSGATIKNLSVDNVFLSSGGRYVGGVAGLNQGLIMACHVSGSVSGSMQYSYVGGLAGCNYGTMTHCHASSSVSGDYNLGGLVGLNHRGILADCYATGAVSGAAYNAGGLVGENSRGSLIACYASGPVSGNSSSGSSAGGLAAKNTKGTIAACYASGSVSGAGYYVGGLVGNNDSGMITSCYAVGFVSGSYSPGGLVGVTQSGFVTYSFWDVQTSGQTMSDGGSGRTTAELQTMATFVNDGWDFVDESACGLNDYWQMTDHDYPRLAGVNWTLAGEGTLGTPYIVANPSDLGKVWSRPSSCYWLANPMDVSGISWSYSVVPAFAGIFDGRGFSISNLTVIRNWSDYIGLFGRLFKGSEVQNLGTENVTMRGSGFVGGLAGENYSGTIRACHTTGSVQGEVYAGGLLGMADYSTITSCYHSGSVRGVVVGGLVGYSSYSTIAGCYAAGAVNGQDESAGGLVGEVSHGSITSSYAACSITGTGEYSCAGGIVGATYDGTVTNCYNSGSVNNIGDYSNTGGLAGASYDSTIKTSYSSGFISGTGAYSDTGGLIGTRSYGTISACFWDKETSGQNTSAGGTGKTTVQMKALTTFTAVGWDFSISDGDAADWWKPNQDYPRLAWEHYAGGSGTAGDPFQIRTPQHFNTIGANPDDWSKHFKLVADIDMSAFSGTQYNMIGNLTAAFSGTFDGNGYAIRNLTYATSEAVDYVGVFGYLFGAAIKNLDVENVMISTGGGYAGGLAGASMNASSISYCSVTGSVRGAGRSVGGLVGWNASPLTHCCSASSVHGSDIYAGGLVGVNYNTIANCFATGSVCGASQYVGGLAGYSGQGTIRNCFATGSVCGMDIVGGFVGLNGSGLIHCYATGSVSGTGANLGGLVGLNTSALTNCFWDVQSSGTSDGVGNVNPDPAGATGHMTMDMKTRSLFILAGWDFADEAGNGVNDYWRMCGDGADYPRLSWEFGRGGDFACPDGVGVEDLEALATKWLTIQGQTGYHSACDANGDGRIDMGDFEVLAEGWIGN